MATADGPLSSLPPGGVVVAGEDIIHISIYSKFASKSSRTTFVVGFRAHENVGLICNLGRSIVTAKLKARVTTAGI